MRERRRADKGKTPKMSTFKGENAKMVIMLNIHNPFSPGERPIRVQLIIIFGGLAFYLFIYFKSVIQQPFITWLFFFFDQALYANPLVSVSGEEAITYSAQIREAKIERIQFFLFFFLSFFLLASHLLSPLI